MEVFGKYKILKEVGKGGFGVVYSSFDERLERQVALKLLRIETIPENQIENFRKRFDQEAKVQANFNHRHIVKIFDYGQIDGLPYLVMPLLQGGSLRERIGKPVNYQKGVQWVKLVAEALCYSHKQGVVHRDVKPSNILFDDEDLPVLTDFGIAKMFDFGKTSLTGTAIAMGTPYYMAPEQWHGIVTESMDQYALGVILYELLTGHTPYKAETPMELAILQATEPLDPPGELISGVPVNVDHFIKKALAFDHEDRFNSMSDFIYALDRLIKAPVGLKRASDVEENISQKHEPDQASITLQADPVPEPINQSISIPANHKQSLQTKTKIEVSQISQGQQSLVPRWSLWIGGSLAVVCVFIVFLGVIIFDVFDLIDQTTPDVESLLLEMSNTEESTQLENTPTAILQASPTEIKEKYELLPSVGPRGVDENDYSVINPANAHKIKEVARFHKGVASDIVWHPTQPVLAVGSSIGVRLYDGIKVEEFLYIDTESWVNAVDFSPDGSLIAAGGRDNFVRLYDAASGRLFFKLEGHEDQVSSVVFSPDGSILASGSHDYSIRLWDISTGNLIKLLQSEPVSVQDVKFSPDGNFLASASFDWSIRLWEVETGRLANTLEGHTDWLNSAIFSPVDDLIASGGFDNTIRIWEVTSGRHLRTLEHHGNSINSLSFSPDGSQLASGSQFDSSIIFWDVNTGEKIKTIAGDLASIDSVAFSPGGEFIAASDQGNGINIWNVDTGELHGKIDDHSYSIECIAISPGGSMLAAGSTDGVINLHDIKSGKISLLLEEFHPVYSVSFSPDGNYLAAGSWGGFLRLWDVKSGQVESALMESEFPITSVAFSQTSPLLVSGGWDSTVRLWDVGTGQLMDVKKGLFYVHDVEISPNERWLAVSDSNATVQLWDLDTNIVVNTYKGFRVVFSPDGSLLATGGGYGGGGWNGPVKIWETLSGNLKAILGEEFDTDYAIVFSPDGEILASGSVDGNLRLWDVKSNQLLMSVDGHNGSIRSIEFSPNGAILSTASDDGTFRLWVVNND
jgi:WD40 repeat protein